MLAYGNGSEEGNVPEEKEELKRIGHCWLMGMVIWEWKEQNEKFCFLLS